MKDCCNEGGDDSRKSKLKTGLNYLVYAIIIIIVVGALAIQLTDK